MQKRTKKQKSSFLGHRSFGRGNVKNRRGSGNRGGRGKAGRHKHKFTWVTAYEPDYFGKYGFARQNKKTMPALNLYEIDRKAQLNKLEKKNGKFYFEFHGKVLGSGMLTFPITIKALAWSKNVLEKVKKVNGEILKLETKTKN